MSAGSEDLKVTLWKHQLDRSVQQSPCGNWVPVDIDSVGDRKCHSHFISGVYLFALKGEELLATSDILDDIYIWRFGSNRDCAEPFLKLSGDLLWIGAFRTVNCAVVLQQSMEVHIYSIEGLEALTHMNSPKLSRVDFCSVCPDRGLIIFTLYADDNEPCSIQVWNLTLSMESNLVLEIESFEPDKHTVSAIATVDSWLITGHADSKIRIWSFTDILVLSNNVGVVNISIDKNILNCVVLKGHTEPIYALEIWREQSFERLLLSGSGDKTIRIWLIKPDPALLQRSCLKILRGHSGYIYTLSVSTLSNNRGCNTPVLFSGGWDSALMVWDLRCIIYDLNWKRRRSFCMFLSFHDFLDKSRTSQSKSGSPAVCRKVSLRLRPKTSFKECLSVVNYNYSVESKIKNQEQLKLKTVYLEEVFRSVYLCSMISSYI